MKVKIVNRSAWPVPAYATAQSAGMDLKADIAEPVVLAPLQRAMIPTGLSIALPDGSEAQVRPRSGLAGGDQGDTCKSFRPAVHCQSRREDRPAGYSEVRESGLG